METSLNFASIETTQDAIQFLFSIRSSIDSAKYFIRDKLVSLKELVGPGKVQFSSEYPGFLIFFNKGWQPNFNQEILKIAQNSHKKLFGVEPLLRGIF